MLVFSYKSQNNFDLKYYSAILSPYYFKIPINRTPILNNNSIKYHPTARFEAASNMQNTDLVFQLLSTKTNPMLHKQCPWYRQMFLCYANACICPLD